MAEKIRSERQVAAIGGDGVLRRTGFGRHHLEKPLDQRTVSAGRGRDQSLAMASAAIMRASPSWPTARSAVTM